MKRTTISLPDEVAAALEREAARQRVPVSQVAREAIEARLGWGPDALPELAFIGIGDSGRTDLAQRMEEILAEEWPDAIRGDR